MREKEKKGEWREIKRERVGGEIDRRRERAYDCPESNTNYIVALQ